MMTSRRVRLAALISVLGLGVSGCSSTDTATAPTADSTASAASSGSAASGFTPPAPTWKPCPGDDLAGLQCAEVSVPLDYAQPDGEKIKLAISRRPHTGSTFHGVMLTNPGGPGGSGRSVPASAANLPNKVGDTYDWIGIDIRGVGASTPNVSCIPDYDKAPQPPFKPADAAATQKWIDRVAGYSDACKKSAGFKVMQHMRTVDHAKDLDSIRRALGVEKVSYWGTSYGTYLGQVFITSYPQHVDKVVLDSVADPQKGWYQSNLDQNVSITKSYRVFLDWVAKQNAVFKLGTDAGAIEKKTYALIDKLAANPPKSGPGSSELVAALIKASYGVGYWPMSGQVLARVLTTGDVSVLSEGKDADPSDNAYAAYLGVQCSESTWPDIQTMIADAKRLAPANPLMTWSNTWLNGPCATWPVKPEPLSTVDAAAFTSPFLMINETLDGATPLSDALAVRTKFASSRLLVGKNGATHASAFSAKPCIADTIANYLSTGAVPARAAGSAPDKECEPVSALAAS